MNGMEGIRFTRNRQNTRSFGKFLAGNHEPLVAGLHSSSQVTSTMGIPFPDQGALFSKLKFRVFCYSLTGIRIARIAPKECRTVYAWRQIFIKP